MDEDTTWYESRKVDLGEGHIVLDGFPALRERGAAQPPLLVSCLLWPRSPISATAEPLVIVAKRLDASRCHLVWSIGLSPGDLCSMGTQLPPEKGHTRPTQFLAHVYCSQAAGWMKPLGTEVDLSAGDFVLHVPMQLSAKGAQQPPLFGPCLLWPRSPISATAELLYVMSYVLALHLYRLPTFSYPPKSVTAAPYFSARLSWPNGRPSQLLLNTCCRNMQHFRRL